MTQTHKWLLTAFLCACAAGVLLHFVHDWLPCAVTALFSPVRESLWEHVKLLFWPILAAGLVLCRRDRAALRPWLLSGLIVIALMLSAGWLFHIVLGGESMAFDIGLYLVLMAAAFLLPRLFPGPWTGLFWELVIWLAAAVGVAVVLFTFWPPDGPLFADLSGAPTWARLPL